MVEASVIASRIMSRISVLVQDLENKEQLTYIQNAFGYCYMQFNRIPARWLQFADYKVSQEASAVVLIEQLMTMCLTCAKFARYKDLRGAINRVYGQLVCTRLIIVGITTERKVAVVATISPPGGLRIEIGLGAAVSGVVVH